MKDQVITFRLSSSTASIVDYLSESLDVSVPEIVRRAVNDYILNVFKANNSEAIICHYMKKVKLMEKKNESIKR